MIIIWDFRVTISLLAYRVFMNSKGQMGVVLLVILIIAVGFFFLYKSGYLSLVSAAPSTTGQNSNPFVPLSLNLSSTTPLAHLYTNENINIVSTMFNHGNRSLDVVLFPYGCSFLPIQNQSVSIPPGLPSSTSWTFSSQSPTTCSIVFSACFNAVSYVEYPLTIESYNFTGTAPVSSITSSSGLPISVGLQAFNTTIVAGPSPANKTEYAAATSLTSYGSASRLNWVKIDINGGRGYFTSFTGQVYAITPSINITAQQYQLNFQNGRLLAPVPFSLTIDPVVNPVGYTSAESVNISAGYTYCITSNSIPITVSQS